MRAAFLGPAGTFSHEAALAAGFEPGPALESIRAVVLAVQEGTAARGVVPVENSLEGGVGATLDALVREAPAVALVGEVLVPVRHCLIGARGPLREIRTHPQAGAQCARYLAAELPGVPVVPTPSTAHAVRSVAAGEPGVAAIGSRHAAELYGAPVLAQDVQDDAANETRFVVLARAEPQPPGEPGPHRTALTFAGDGAGEPGWLVRCLSEFAFRGVNLTRIESRPARRGLGSYRFFVDLDGAIGSEPVDGAIRALAVVAGEVRVLGSYAAAPRGADGA